MNSKLKQLIARRQRALAEGDLDQYRDLRNRVNRERKLCRARLCLQFSDSRSPSQLLGGEKLRNLAVCLAHQVACTLPHCTSTVIVANQYPLPCKTSLTRSINNFLAPMNVFEPLAADTFPRPITEERPLKVSELSAFKKMLSLNPSKAMGPDGVPGWLLKENAELFAQAVADILNCSFEEARLPSS